jgi:hypothetical protein
VQESARTGAHKETGTSTTLDECTCIDRVLNIIDILSNQHNHSAIVAVRDEFIAADADEFIAAGLGDRTSHLGCA